MFHLLLFFRKTILLDFLLLFFLVELDHLAAERLQYVRICNEHIFFGNDSRLGRQPTGASLIIEVYKLQLYELFDILAM